MAVATSLGLFVLVLVLIIAKPRGLSIGWTAVGGAALALLLGTVSWANVGTVVGIVWDATLTFVAIVIISLILDAAGFFEWSALHMVRLAGGDGRRLFWLLGVLGALVAMLFANDGAALILTPIVYEQAKALRLDRAATLALIMASGFIADTTSLPLVVSNLVNIVSAGYFHLGFGSYAARMLPVDVVALLASLGVLALFYRRALPRTVAAGTTKSPAEAVRDPRVFRWSWLVLALLMGGYFASQLLSWPVAVFAGAAAVALLLMAGASQAMSVRTIVWEAPWRIVVFSIGMYVVVYGLKNVGLTRLLAELFTHAAGHGVLVAVLGTGMVTAVLSAVMNNLPTVLIGAIAVHQAGVEGAMRTAMAYANVVGADLGPKFTPIGSLATLLWLDVLDRRGVHITWGYYFRVGIALTAPVLLLTLLALVAWSHVLPA